jgi:glutamate--cysteine ligase catalytic subunit
MRQFLKSNQVPLTVTMFPRFGAAGPFTDPHIANDTFENAHSLFVGDDISYGAARYTYAVYS